VARLTDPAARVVGARHGGDQGRIHRARPGEQRDRAPGEGGDWVVAFEMRPDKKRGFYEFTNRNVGRLMAIVLDNKCQMAPVIKSPLPVAASSRAKFTARERPATSSSC